MIADEELAPVCDSAKRFLRDVESGKRDASERAVSLARTIAENGPMTPPRRALIDELERALHGFADGEIGEAEKDAVVAGVTERFDRLDALVLEAAAELADLLAGEG
jgi:hypothetical protein